MTQPMDLEPLAEWSPPWWDSPAHVAAFLFGMALLGVAAGLITRWLTTV